MIFIHRHATATRNDVDNNDVLEWVHPTWSASRPDSRLRKTGCGVTDTMAGYSTTRWPADSSYVGGASLSLHTAILCLNKIHKVLGLQAINRISLQQADDLFIWILIQIVCDYEYLFVTITSTVEKYISLNSLERRRERYIIMYVWCILEWHAPNVDFPWSCGIDSHWHIRRGRYCQVPRVSHLAPATVQSIRYGSFALQGPRLFNTLPPELRNMTNCSSESFKQALDTFLKTIPDEPQTPGYTCMRRAESNSKGILWFYIALYPVRWTAQNALHFPPLADLFIPTPFSASLGSILAMQQ